MKKIWGCHGRHTLEKAIENFLARAIPDSNNCWNWAGTIGSHKRYGTVSIAGRHMLAHRASWLLFRGEPGKLFVLHKCDNGFCVNPDHLFLGTQKDNVLDMEGKKRSRHPKLEEHGRAKLTFAKIADAKSRVSNGELIKDIAAEFGVHRRTLGLALMGRTWITKQSPVAQTSPRDQSVRKELKCQ